LVPDITNPYFSGVIKGAERAAAGARLTLVLGDTAENATTEAELIQRLERAVDGFVISASRLTDDQLRAAAERTPIALVNRATAGLACVVADFDTGTQQIVDHLASFGHRSLVFVGGPAESWSGARRWQGLQAASRERKMEARRFGPAAADAVLTSGATAVVCHNDMLAIGLMRRLAERGMSVPRDVSVVGFDNIFGADFCHPTLTTLAERTEDAGARAVEQVVQQVPSRQVEGPTRVLPTHLVVRASTGPVPA
jgi:LacI family repressor for deo operon, udp, cdd, tsx, nupC, and nupG